MNCIHRIGASCTDRCDGEGEIEDAACLGTDCPGYEEWAGLYDVARCYILCTWIADAMSEKAQSAQEVSEHWLGQHADVTAADIASARQRRLDNGSYSFA